MCQGLHLACNYLSNSHVTHPLHWQRCVSTDLISILVLSVQYNSYDGEGLDSTESFLQLIASLWNMKYGIWNWQELQECVNWGESFTIGYCVFLSLEALKKCYLKLLAKHCLHNYKYILVSLCLLNCKEVLPAVM